MRIFGCPERRVSIHAVSHLVMFSALAMVATFAVPARRFIRCSRPEAVP